MKAEIEITISEKLLSNIEANIKGDTRNDKLQKSIEKGYQIFIEREKND